MKRRPQGPDGVDKREAGPAGPGLAQIGEAGPVFPVPLPEGLVADEQPRLAGGILAKGGSERAGGEDFPKLDGGERMGREPDAGSGGERPVVEHGDAADLAPRADGKIREDAVSGPG